MSCHTSLFELLPIIAHTSSSPLPQTSSPNEYPVITLPNPTLPSPAHPLPTPGTRCFGPNIVLSRAGACVEMQLRLQQIYYFQMAQNRANILKFLYQTFPYLQYIIVNEEDVSSDELERLMYGWGYAECQQHPTFLKLKKMNDQFLKKHEEDMNKKNRRNYYNDHSHYNTNQQNYQQQYVDYSQMDPQMVQMYMHQMNMMYSNRMGQAQANQMYNYKDPNTQPYMYQTDTNDSYLQMGYGYPQQLELNQGADDTRGVTYTEKVEPPKVEETKPEPVEAPSPTLHKEASPKTEPSTPAEAPVEKPIEEKPVPKMVFETFAELRKSIIDLKDFSGISEAFKSKVEEINKREPIYEEIRVNKRQNQNYKKNDTAPPKPVHSFQVGGGLQSQPSKTQPQTFTCDIIRREDTAELKEVREQLNKYAKDGGFIEKMKMKTLTLSDLKKAEKEIKYNLNLITLENFTAIKRELEKYVLDDEKTCESLINLMIEKAWIEPKFATIYARLSSEFGKLDKFKWGGEKKEEGKKSKINPFKTVLIKVVQQVFEDDFTGSKKEAEDIIEEASEGAKVEKPKEDFDAKTIKKKVIGNVRFIGQLLLQKVLNKKIVYYCTGHLIEAFLKHYALASAGQKHSELAEIYFESLVELIEKVGAKFENDEDKLTPEDFEGLKEKISNAISESKPLGEIKPEDWILKTERFFQLFQFIDKQILGAKFPRISALLRNLTERKKDNWRSHVVENKGPMTLNDARRDDGDEPEYEVQKKATKKETFEYEKELKKIFDKHDKGKLPKEEDPDELIDYSSDLVEADLKRLFKQDAYEIVSTFIRMFADGNKNVLERRVALFQTMLDLNFAKYDHVKQGWLKNSGKLCYADLPLVAVYFPKIMALVNKTYAIKLEDWQVKTDDEEEQDYAQTIFNRFKDELAGPKPPKA